MVLHIRYGVHGFPSFSVRAFVKEVTVKVNIDQS